MASTWSPGEKRLAMADSWPAVVNHGIGHGLQDFLRNGHRPRDAQILRWNGLARFDLRDRDSFALLNSHLLLRLYRQNRPVMLRKNTSYNKKIRRITAVLPAALLITLQTKYSITVGDVKHTLVRNFLVCKLSSCL